MTLQNETRQIVSPTLHATIFFSVFIFWSIVAASFFFKVEIVSTGTGKVVPIGRVQLVQPEFGGQIKAIHVRDGKLVQKGDILVELDGTRSQATVNALQAERDRLQVELFRIRMVLETTLIRNSINQEYVSKQSERFSNFLLSKQTPYHEGQVALLEAELTELRDRLDLLAAEMEANERSMQVTSASIEGVETVIETQRERLENIQTLMNKGTASRANYLDVLDAFNRLVKEREILLRELGQKDAQATALVAERAAFISTVRSDFQTIRTNIESRNEDLMQELVAAKRQLASTQLIAPVTGVIDQLTIYTIGGVVSPGQDLMRVVPENQKFEIEAVFSNVEVGFLNAGQEANIKFDAYPSERFGFLRGRVSSISADAIDLGKEEFGFIVRIQPEETYLGTSDNSYSIQSGMTSSIDVITGNRRIISYFFAPIVKVVQSSLGER